MHHFPRARNLGGVNDVLVTEPQSFFRVPAKVGEKRMTDASTHTIRTAYSGPFFLEIFDFLAILFMV